MYLQNENGGFTYETTGPLGLEPGNIAIISSRPCLIHSIYIITTLGIGPLPLWAMLMDRTQAPQAGMSPDVPGPRIAVAGSLIQFIPPVEKQDVTRDNRNTNCDPDNIGVLRGHPFSNGCVLALSTAPFVFAPIGGAFIRVVARGRIR
jgi:hypothetical protein